MIFNREAQEERRFVTLLSKIKADLLEIASSASRMIVYLSVFKWEQWNKTKRISDTQIKDND